MAKFDAVTRGAQGEARVHDLLTRTQPQFGYALLDDLLINFNGHTSQIDHALIDHFGVLVIETKNYAARLKGRSDEKYWTACYPNGRTRQMYNPLRQNDGHRSWLHRFLTQYGRTLDERYVQSLIVFAKGEIDSLELEGVDGLRVIAADHLTNWIEQRYDFQPNEGNLGPEAQADLVEFLVSQDKSGDPSTVQRHIESARAAKAGRTSVKRPNPQQLSRSRRANDELLTLVAKAAVLIAVLSGLWLMSRGCTTAMALPVSSPASQVSAGTAPFDAALALRALREGEPELASSLIDPGSPALSVKRGLPTHTWRYKQGTGPRDDRAVHLRDPRRLRAHRRRHQGVTEANPIALRTAMQGSCRRSVAAGPTTAVATDSSLRGGTRD